MQAINQERVWKWERAGWICMGVLLLSGLVEILAPTPVAHSMAKTVGLHPTERHIQSKTRTARLDVEVGPEATVGDELILRVAAKNFQRLEVQTIIPPPTKVVTSGDTYEYVFPVKKQHEPLTIHFVLRSSSAGRGEPEMDFSTPGALAFSRFLAQ